MCSRVFGLAFLVGVLTILSPLPAAGGTAAVANNRAGGTARTTDDKALSDAINDFSLDLYGKLVPLQPDTNLFASPYSASAVLAMVLVGARGDTEKEMADVLHLYDLAERDAVYGRLIASLNSRKGTGYDLKTANALWGQKGHRWLKAFLDLTASAYGAPLHEVDFLEPADAAKEINDWCSQQTEGKIRELLKPEDIKKPGSTAVTNLVLTNAVYFKGKWSQPFQKERTTPEPFTIQAGKAVQAQMMKQHSSFLYAEQDGVQVLEMPYVGGDLSMVVFLPGEVTGLRRLEATLTGAKVKEALLRLRGETADVTFPKFLMTWGPASLVGPLASLGMKDAFQPMRADFSGMDGKQHGLLLEDVLQKTFVDVNEEGTEAAAATAGGMMALGMPQKPVVFRADHPFIFLIRDNRTGVILFIGRVTDPTKES